MRATAIHEQLAERNAIAQCRYPLGVSIGYSQLGSGIDAIRTCIDDADAALYEQKKAGSRPAGN